MVKIDVDIPESLDMKVQRLVDEGEFMDYESAINELISTGVTAYRTDNDKDDSFDDDFSDDIGPGGVSHDDDYAF